VTFACVVSTPVLASTAAADGEMASTDVVVDVVVVGAPCGVVTTGAAGGRDVAPSWLSPVLAGEPPGLGLGTDAGAAPLLAFPGGWLA